MTEELKKYKRIKQIGAGAQGEVFLLEKEGEQYALKVYGDIIPEKSIEREIEILTQKSHPHILKIAACGTLEKSFYTITEYATGGTLEDCIEKGELNTRERMLILRDALLGLEYLHNENIVHRDIKPGNIFIGVENGSKKGIVGDFGLAKSRDDTLMDYSSLGGMIGTMPYLTPEYLRNETRNLDARSDLYAIGVSLYMSITGHYPYGNSEQEILANLQNLNYKPPVIRKYIQGVPEGLQQLCKRAIEVNSQERFLTARQFITNIEELLEEEELAMNCPKPGDVQKRNVEQRGAKRISRHVNRVQKNKRVKKVKGMGLQYGLVALALFGVAATGYFISNTVAEKQDDVEANVEISSEELIEKALDEKKKRNYKLAYQFYNKAAELGESKAQYEIGNLYKQGVLGGYDDEKQMLRWYTLAAEGGNDKAMIEIGNYYYNSKGKKRNEELGAIWYQKALKSGNYTKAHITLKNKLDKKRSDDEINDIIKMYMKASAANNIECMVDLGMLYEEGVHVEKNLKNAIELYKKAIEHGNTRAMIEYAKILVKSKEESKEKGLKMYNMAIEKGDLRAYRELGELYAEGEYVKKDIAKALKLFREASKKGDGKAMEKVGMSYAKGEGVKTNMYEAIKWFKKSIDHGNYDAIAELLMMARSNPYKKHIELSFILNALQEGVKDNHPLSTKVLGDYYVAGRGVPQNYTKGIKLYKRSIDLGDEYAYVPLANMYLTGLGTPANFEKALEFFEKGKIDPMGKYIIDQIYKDEDLFITSIPSIKKEWKRETEELGVYKIKKSTYVLKAFEYLGKKGYSTGYYYLGLTYDQGNYGVEQNYKKAGLYYQKSIKLGSGYAHGKLGILYFKGKGTKKSYKKAYELFTIGAEKYTDPDAMKFLAHMYTKGIYVKKNSEKYWFWYRKLLMLNADYELVKRGRHKKK